MKTAIKNYNEVSGIVMSKVSKSMWNIQARVDESLMHKGEEKEAKYVYLTLPNEASFNGREELTLSRVEDYKTGEAEWEVTTSSTGRGSNAFNAFVALCTIANELIGELNSTE